VSMTGNNAKSEVLRGPERRRRWAAAEKISIVAETYESDVTVSLVARRHGVAPNQVFSWRRLAAQGALTRRGQRKRSFRRRIIAPCKSSFARCSACSARRRWRPRS
jgi:transposase-like protein